MRLIRRATDTNFIFLLGLLCLIKLSRTPFCAIGSLNGKGRSFCACLLAYPFPGFVLSLHVGELRLISHSRKATRCLVFTDNFVSSLLSTKPYGEALAANQGLAYVVHSTIGRQIPPLKLLEMAR